MIQYSDSKTAGYRTCFTAAKDPEWTLGGDCLEIVDGDEGTDNLTCAFHFDTHNYPRYSEFPLPAGVGFKDVAWSCRLKATKICDGASQCLTDECQCHGNQSDVFFCADGSGCVTWDRFCDGFTHDCMDSSDECFCAGYVGHVTSKVNGNEVCVPDGLNCTIVEDASMLRTYFKCDDDADSKRDSINPIEFCLMEAFDEFYTLFLDPLTARVSEYCQANCSHVEKFEDGWERFCNHTRVNFDTLVGYSFQCDPKDWVESFSVNHICDGEIDCRNQADEIGCPGRFYCRDNHTAEWVDSDKTCDNTKDCANGADECGTCEFGALSSSEFLIQSRVILVITILMGIVIIVMNIKEGYKCWIMSCSSKARAIDKTILLQIFFHDTLMGVYLCFIVLASIVLRLKGDYCMVERQWRASPICSILGVLFSFSSHGSLLGITMISCIRFLTCHSLVVDINKRVVVIGSALIAVLNLFHSVFPLIPVKVIKNTFRTEVFFKNLDENPFFSSNPLNMTRLATVYQGLLHREDDDVLKMISELSNVTTKGEIFDISEISYYGNTGLCIHNIFKSQPSYEIYKIIYCIVLLALLSVVCTTYIKIVLKQRRSAQAVNADGPGEQDSVAAALTLKVALMIGSQLACWIPFILAALYFQYLTKKPAAPKVFEVFALVVIPVNSFLNPVFYSETYKKVKDAAWIKWRLIVSYVAPLRVPDRPEGPSGVITMAKVSTSREEDQGSIPTGDK